jgi:predicted DCC family thiol-disulfide oxidoreductase YuxK
MARLQSTATGPALGAGRVRAKTNPVRALRRADSRSKAERKSGPVVRLRQFWLGEVNLAPLGLFRIVYGVLLFNWFWQLLPNLASFFTDEGMLPRRSLLAFYPNRFSLLSLVGEWWQVCLFWFAGLAVALMLTVGWRTRTASTLAFLFVMSFQWRDPLVLDGSDLVFRLVPFWLIFTSAGGRYSVDAAIRRVHGDPPSGGGPALPVRLLELQVAWIYLATGLEKLGGKMWPEGTAAYYALQLQHTFGRTHAEWLALSPFFQRLVSWNTLAIELLFLPLVFSPILNRPMRILALAGAAMLHGGILALMNVGNFPVIMLAALILYLPPGLVHRLVDEGRRLLPRSQVRMYYDGNCHFCRRTSAYLRAFDIYHTITFVDFRTIDAARIGLCQRQLEQRIHVIDERGRVTRGFAAMARAARAVPLLWPLAVLCRLPGLPRVAERVYDWMTARRMLLLSCPGGVCELHPSPRPSSALRVPREVHPGWRRAPGYLLLTIVAAGAFATALPASLAAYRPREPVSRLLQFASLDQYWAMFAPEPAHSDGWLLGPARLADGTQFDLFSGGPPSDQPRYADPFYSRWAKATERIVDTAYTDYRVEYGRMFCRLRNWHLQPGQSPLASFELDYMERIIPPPGGGEPTLVKHHLWSHVC